jgi:hypothetical protein
MSWLADVHPLRSIDHALRGDDVGHIAVDAICGHVPRPTASMGAADIRDVPEHDLRPSLDIATAQCEERSDDRSQGASCECEASRSVVAC